MNKFQTSIKGAQLNLVLFPSACDTACRLGYVWIGKVNSNSSLIEISTDSHRFPMFGRVPVGSPQGSDLQCPGQRLQGHGSLVAGLGAVGSSSADLCGLQWAAECL